MLATHPMKPVRFAFAVHSRQPFGDFDSVFRETFERLYRPLCEVLRRHPGVKCAVRGRMGLEGAVPLKARRSVGLPEACSKGAHRR